MATVLLALGSNMGDRRAKLIAAIELLGRLPETQVTRVSRFVETPPIGGPSGQSAFLNAAAEIETSLAPRGLLEYLHRIEGRLGRVRRELNGPRTIDLDILLWGEERFDSPELVIPHPRMHFRRFVLEPLVEIAADARHPAGFTVGDRWRRLNQPPHYLAITGPMGVGKTTLARALAARLEASFVAEVFDSERLGRLFAGDEREAPAVQEHFLASRCELLDPARWRGIWKRWVVSDFWFAQSLAYSTALFDDAGSDLHRAAVAREAHRVLEPSLVVWLDATPHELATRVAMRGRDFEAAVETEFLARLQAGYARLLTGPSAPPLVRPEATTIEGLLDELRIVCAAIDGGTVATTEGDSQ